MEYTRNEKNKHMSQREFLYYLDLYHKGDREALNYLISEHLWVVENVIQYYQDKNKTDYNELFSAGLEYLWKAIERYDSSFLNPFENYAFVIIRNRLDYISRHNLPNKDVISLKEYHKQEKTNLTFDDKEIIDDADLYNLVIEKLNNKYNDVVHLYYHNGLSSAKVGDVLGYSRSEIARRISLATRYLKYEMYDAGLIGSLEEDEYRKYKIYRHRNPVRFYDLFISLKGKELDPLLIDTLLYFASVNNKKGLIENLGPNYMNGFSIPSKEVYNRVMGIKRLIMRPLETICKEDLYAIDPADLTLLYLNKHAPYIYCYFRNLQTGEKLDERLVNFLIENNPSLRIYLQENGFNYSNYRMQITNVYQWLRIKKFIPEFLDELQRTIGEDIFKLNVQEAIYKCDRALKHNHNFMRKLIVN